MGHLLSMFNFHDTKVMGPYKFPPFFPARWAGLPEIVKTPFSVPTTGTVLENTPGILCVSRYHANHLLSWSFWENIFYVHTIALKTFCVKLTVRIVRAWRKFGILFVEASRS